MLKYKLLKILLIILCFFLISTSCSKKQIDNDNVIYTSKEPFTLMLPSVSVFKGYTVDTVNPLEYVKVIQNQLQEKGLNIKLDIYGTYEQYKQHVKAKLASEKSIAFDSFYFLNEDLEQLIEDGSIKEISSEFKKYAPEYYLRTIGNKNLEIDLRNMGYIKTENNKDKIYKVPLGNSQSCSCLAILVKKDIDKAFGRKIVTFEDYVGLLKFIKNTTSYKPGLLESVFIYNFIAQFEGYSSIINHIGKGNTAAEYSV